VSITVAARKTVPAYTLRGYKVRGVLYGRGAIPLERAEAELPALKPGEHATVYLAFQDKAPSRFSSTFCARTGIPR
jgi:hypothetical protein